MSDKRSVSRLFASSTLVRLLTVFLMEEKVDYYQSELVQRTASSLHSVQRELTRLNEVGLIRYRKKGNRSYYQARPDHPAFRELANLFVKTIALGDVLRWRFASIPEIRLAFLFGSVARGEEQPESDIDLFLVTDLSLKQLSPNLEEVQLRLRREINAVVFPLEELQKKWQEQNHFLLEIIGAPKIFLVGDEHALQRILS
ncbi:MAG: nucleotidyltransferase domain-containing protein [Coprothermobacterota bacterium]|nr:nucleotidyltransferase domain-containing protein [Coprothermobacterota bacterium]